MIGLDTNVLVRYLVNDDLVQSDTATALLDSLSPSEPGWISVIVLVEMVWVLTRVYKLSRDAMIVIVENLLASKDIQIEDREKVHEALALHRSGRAGLIDCLIAVSARAAGCTRTVTFDRNAARDAGMELLG